MRGFPNIFVLTLLVAISCALANERSNVFAVQISMPSGSHGNLLVLKNGEVLHGKIIRSAKKFVIETSQGSRLVLQSKQVDFVCNSLVEAYWEKCARTKASDVRGQTALFHWCLKHELPEQAQNQINLLTETGIKASDLAALDRQFNSLLERNKTQTTSTGSSNSEVVMKKRNPAKQNANPVFLHQATDQPALDASKQLGSNKLTPLTLEHSIGVPRLNFTEIDTSVFKSLPSMRASAPKLATQLIPLENALQPIRNKPTDTMVDHSVRQVGFEQPIESPRAGSIQTIDEEGRSVNTGAGQASDSPNASSSANVSLEEIERRLQQLPKPFVGFYRKRVAKLMTNGCKAAKCHEMNDEVMPLMHRSRTLPLIDGMSKRNLYFMSFYIDQETPGESPLYLAATQPHAGKAKPIFKPGSKQLKNLERWLGMLGTGSMKLDRNEEKQTQIDDLSSRKSAEAVTPIKPSLAEELPEGAAELASPIKEIPNLESESKKYSPIDPFDPEIFNRRHRK